MIYYYLIKRTLYHHGKAISSECVKGLSEFDKLPPKSQIKLTWGNLEKELKNAHIHFPFIIKERKHGKVLIPEDTWHIIKQKNELLDMVINIEYRELQPSLKELMEWHDAAKVVQYMKERNLTF